MSQYDPNETYYRQGMMPYMQQQYMQQQYMQQQYAMMNPLQYQVPPTGFNLQATFS
jgi:hypothetical protein